MTESVAASAGPGTQAARTLVVGTAGHIDHGKSALVRALTGIDPDRLKEERERGITIDLGFAHARIGDLNVAFVDVPGHERFVKNMLAGVGGIDAVLLVVAADESIMPQTREHFDICRLLQVPAGVVALTKSDLVDIDTIELVRLELRDLVAGSFLDNAPVIPVSAKTGEGLDAIRETLSQLARLLPERSTRGAIRLPIDRAFSMKGFGTVVTGTLVSGVIRQDEELIVLPRAHPVKVRGVQVHGVRQPEVAAGNRVALNLGGIELAEIGRGDSLVAPAAFVPTRAIDVVVDVIESARAVRHGARVRFHHGTTELLGRVALGPRVKDTNWKDRTPAAAQVSEIAPGSRAFARIRLERPAVLTREDRFILRAYSPPLTIAGGIVLDPHPPRTGIRTATAAQRFATLNGSGPRRTTEALVWMVSEAAAAGFPCVAVASRLGVSPADAPAVIQQVIAPGDVTRVADTLVATDVLVSLEKQLLALLADYHRRQPLAQGMPREEARERVFAHAQSDLFDFVTSKLVAAKKIVGREHLALSTHQLALSPEEERARTALERAFEAGGLKPPELTDIAAAERLPGGVIDRIVNLLVRQKVLTRIDTLIFHRAALDRLRAEITALKAQSPGRAVEIDVGAFKERYGVSRKYAIPLLEYLDRERITRRVGDKRMVV